MGPTFRIYTMPSSLSSTVALGAGCFWGTEKYVAVEFQKIFPNSIKSTKVGYMSPHQDHMTNPSYRQVCTGQTGHVEVLNVELNDPETHFEDLIKFFFLFHDPTTMDRQGNDTGTQYASAIFVNDEEQKNIATKVMDELQDALDNGALKKKSPYTGAKVVTQIHDATTFYDAEDYHQQYLMKNPGGYCNHRFRMKKWPVE